MKLVRNRTGTVHRPDCSSRGQYMVPWTYATTRTLDDIKADTAAYPWLHLCRTCMPGCCSCGRCKPPEAGR